MLIFLQANKKIKKMKKKINVKVEIQMLSVKRNVVYCYFINENNVFLIISRGIMCLIVEKEKTCLVSTKKVICKNIYLFYCNKQQSWKYHRKIKFCILDI